MSLKKQTNKQTLFLLWRQLERCCPHSLHLGLPGSFFWSLSRPPKALWLAWGGVPGTAHSLLTLVLQECSTTLKRRGSCSKGTFTIFPGDKAGREELAVAASGRACPSSWAEEQMWPFWVTGARKVQGVSQRHRLANILIPRPILGPEVKVIIIAIIQGILTLCWVFKCIISLSSHAISVRQILPFIPILQMRNLKLRGIPRCPLKAKIPRETYIPFSLFSWWTLLFYKNCSSE